MTLNGQNVYTITAKQKVILNGPQRSANDSLTNLFVITATRLQRHSALAAGDTDFLYVTFAVVLMAFGPDATDRWPVG